MIDSTLVREDLRLQTLRFVQLFSSPITTKHVDRLYTAESRCRIRCRYRLGRFLRESSISLRAHSRLATDFRRKQALGMIFISSLLARAGTANDNEEFTVAKRSLKTGLTAAGVVSSWTWFEIFFSLPRRFELKHCSFFRSTTLLSSCVVAYQYGVSGSLFYALVPPSPCQLLPLPIPNNLVSSTCPSTVPATRHKSWHTRTSLSKPR
jgi:hypothetical protein